MKSKLKILLRFLFFLKEIKIGLSRGALGASIRNSTPLKPVTWEFSAFSQNGEDGILDFLTTEILKPNKYFIEIGTSNGLANNTAYLAFVKKFCGIMVEGNKLHSKLSSVIFNIFNKGVTPLNYFVTKDNIQELLKESITLAPDVFSLDIDGNDFYLVESILKNGMKPKIFVVEYNANFGPDKCLTIPYTPNFNYATAHTTRLYFGVSIAAWRKLFQTYDYEFLTVETNGINAFFILKSAFPENFTTGMEKIYFLDNKIELQLFKLPWEKRFEFISKMPIVEI